MAKLYVNKLAGKNTYITSDHMPEPSSNQASHVEHKFKDNVTKNISMAMTGIK